MTIRTRDELIEALSNGDHSLTTQEQKLVAMWMTAPTREPTQYKVTWVQVCHQLYNSYDEALSHARILSEQGNKCSDVRLTGAYTISSDDK